MKEYELVYKRDGKVKTTLTGYQIAFGLMFFWIIPIAMIIYMFLWFFGFYKTKYITKEDYYREKIKELHECVKQRKEE